MAKKFAIPFAATGDKAVVPDALQPDGSVSYTQGFGPDYELDRDVDPVNAKDVPRDETNQLFFDVTDAIGEIQKNGAALWSSAMAPYPINARVYYADKVWRSNIINNNGEPGVSANWDDVSVQMPSLLDSVRTDVVSNSTVNLSSLALTTRHINITGTTTINAFTVAVGQCFFVRFAGAMTLTNSASLVTNSGANITTSAGDTCIIRATAANQVEVLCYTPGIPQEIGYRQTWQDLTASRATGTTYTNTTGRPIMVSVAVSQIGSIVTSVTVAGVVVGTIINEVGFERSLSTFVVPDGATYSLSSGSTLAKWAELR